MLARYLIRDVVDFLYPQSCLACRENASLEQSSFCSDCQAAISSHATLPGCPVCASPLPAGAECGFCNGNGISPFGRIVALAPFRGQIRKIVHRMKFGHRWNLAEALAEPLLSQPRTGRLLGETDVLVPVPLYWSRQIARGYNQADVLAAFISRRCRIPIARPLVRRKNTVAQWSLRSITDRQENLRDAFELIDDAKIEGKRVTLVDDVLTTASTLKSAARALKSAHPAGLNALVLAVADPHRRDFQTV